MDGVKTIKSITSQLTTNHENENSIACLLMCKGHQQKGTKTLNQIVDFLVSKNGEHRDGDQKRVVSALVPHSPGSPPFIVVVALEDGVDEKELAAGVECAFSTFASDLSGTARVCVHPSWTELDPIALYIELKLAFWVYEGRIAAKPAVCNVLVLTTSNVEQDDAGKAESLAYMKALSMNLIQAPANSMTPEKFVKKIKDVILSARLKDSVKWTEIGESQLRELDMNLLLATANGSCNRPRVLVLEYYGDPKNEKIVALIGKGVTFDSGGISLKPARNMHEMKTDMGGASICVSTLLAIAAQKREINVVAVVGLIENMPSGSAYRPGDVLTSKSGKTVEILDTDAEGRNVLADIMWYAGEKFKPSQMITVATLTGAIVTALGHQWAGLYSKDQKLCEELLSASKTSGDGLWRMPFDSKSMEADLTSPVADIRHLHRGDGADSIYAAIFLSNFVKESDVGSWAHIDCAGTVYKEDYPTGWGPMLLFDWLCNKKKLPDQ